MHPILAKIDDLEMLIGNSSEIAGDRIAYHRKHLRRMRDAVEADLRAALMKENPEDAKALPCDPVKPLGGLLDTERARQASVQNDADHGGYLPVRMALARGM